MPHEAVFPHASFKSHMPFFDGQTLLFCQADEPIHRELRCGGPAVERLEGLPDDAEHPLPRSCITQYRPWRLAYCTWADRVPYPIETGFPPDTVHCSPTFYHHEGQVHVSFIAGIACDFGFRYRLYEMVGPSLDALSPPAAVGGETRLGFVSADRTCVASARNLLLTERATGVQTRLRVPFRCIYRASFCADNARRLVLSAFTREKRDATFVYDLGGGEVHEIVSGEWVYKATIGKDLLIHPQRISAAYEDYELHFGPFRLIPAAVTIRPEPATLRKRQYPRRSAPPFVP
jgi:hypothetical protein